MGESDQLGSTALSSGAAHARGANPDLQVTRRTRQPRGGERHPAAWASGTRHPPIACTSHWNAAPTVADHQLVRVTHPFHPLFARQLPCVGRRSNRHGERLLLQSGDARIWPVPPQWTDLVSQDPEIVMGQGRMLLRVADLLELCALVQHLSGQAMARHCKDNYAAHVRQITPRGG